MHDAVAKHKGVMKGASDMNQQHQCEQRNGALVHCFQEFGQFRLLWKQIRNLE